MKKNPTKTPQSPSRTTKQPKRSPKQGQPKTGSRASAKRSQAKPAPPPEIPVNLNPSDLKRPAPNEPVRIQPPSPQFAQGRRATLDANRWVHQRANQPRGGQLQTHSHPSVRGR